MWVAWLNLENLYGQPPGEAAMALFRRALPHVNQKRLYLALLAILQRTERARHLSAPTCLGACPVESPCFRRC